VTRAAASFRLRPLRAEDAAAALEIYAPLVRETAISFEELPPTLVEMKARIEAGSRAFPWLAAVDAQDQLQGYAYACSWRARPAYAWTCEVSVYTSAATRRQGVGALLYRGLLQELLQQGYVEAYAGVTLPNGPSVAFHEAFGFLPVAIFAGCGYKHGAWHDVGFWRFPLAARSEQPLKPYTSRSSTCRE